MTYQKQFNKILGFGEEFLWEFILQLYYLLEYQVLIPSKEKTQTQKEETYRCITR